MREADSDALASSGSVAIVEDGTKRPYLPSNVSLALWVWCFVVSVKGRTESVVDVKGVENLQIEKR